MEEIIRLLTDNPILLILLVMWILSALGGVFTRAARKAEQERRRAAEQRRQAQGSSEPVGKPVSGRQAQQQKTPQQRTEQRRARGQNTVEWPEQKSRWEQPVPARPQPEGPMVRQWPQQSQRSIPPTPPRQARADRSRPMSPEEAAAEIRRLMGMEEAPTRRESPRAELRPEREAEWGRAARPLREREARDFEIRVDPHVGEAIHDRHLAPRRSRLAGDRREGDVRPDRATGRRAYELSELRNLPKALVLREILGPPKALQDEWQW